MRIIVELPHVSEERTTRCCVALLQAAIACGAIVEEELGPAPPLYGSGIRFEQEPFTDGEHFDLPWEVHARGWADCDDATIARMMELRRAGKPMAPAIALLAAKIPPPDQRKPLGYCIPRVLWRTGKRSYHAQHRREDGSIEDAAMILEHERQRA